MKKRSLTGIKPTGMPHIGNWVGAINPALELAKTYDALYFIADYHAFTTTPSPEDIKSNTYAVAATWLALGLETKNAIFYRQSDIPEIFELSWLLSCFTPKGFMNRAHGYKDFVSKNESVGNDPDFGINMGLFSYPVLMTADILLFGADIVPIGQDQKQHLEFARDIAARVNGHYKSQIFNLPEPLISEGAQTVTGLDGRKMSKSYDNTIPLFLEEKKLKKLINRIVTNSQSPEEPKDPEKSNIFKLHKLFLDIDQENEIRQIYSAGGMGWGNAKSMLFETINETLSKPRQEFCKLMNDKGHIERVLRQGAEKARAISIPFLKSLKDAIGISHR
jgi:tryptophanyl-tRNA synthetase